MRKHNIICLILSLCFSLALSACDEGTIYEKELVIPQNGFTCRLTANITGLDTWPNNYELALAGLSSDDAVTIYKVITSNGDVSIDMSNINENIAKVQLCIMEKASRKSIIAYKEIEKENFNAENDIIAINAGNIDVSMYATIQEYIFNDKCISCHGSQGSAPRNLFLTTGRSYDDLVNVQSKANSQYVLVKPNNAANSLLPLVLSENGLIAHDHADILDARKSTTLVALIKDWINNGAKE